MFNHHCVGRVSRHRVTCSLNELYATHGGLDTPHFGDLVLAAFSTMEPLTLPKGGPHVRPIFSDSESGHSLSLYGPTTAVGSRCLVNRRPRHPGCVDRRCARYLPTA